MRRSRRWSSVALVIGACLFFVASIAGFLNANIVNGQRFAQHVNSMRQDPALAAAIGAELAAAVVDADPDLVAIQPAIEGGAATLVASSAFNGIFTSAVASFHSALTEAGSDSAVLTIADLGSSAISLLDAIAPDVAQNVPADLDVTLAQIGGQEGPAAGVIAWFQAVTAMALLLPVLAIAVWVVAVMIAPDRRMAVLRVGRALIAVAATLGALLAIGWVASRLVGRGTAAHRLSWNQPSTSSAVRWPCA